MQLESPLLRFSAAQETMSKNPLTLVMKAAGAVTLRRSFREGDRDVNRPVDLEGAERVEGAIRSGWLLHYPAGTTRKGAPLRPGVAKILHNTRAVAVPVRVDGFRHLLLLRQVPGKLLRACRIHIHPPMDLAEFYAAPFSKESGQRVLGRLQELIGDPPE